MILRSLFGQLKLLSSAVVEHHEPLLCMEAEKGAGDFAIKYSNAWIEDGISTFIDIFSRRGAENHLLICNPC